MLKFQKKSLLDERENNNDEDGRKSPDSSFECHGEDFLTLDEVPFIFASFVGKNSLLGSYS